MAKKEKPFDADQTYQKVLKFYIEKKQYSPEHANRLAMDVVKREQQRRGLIK